MHKYFIIFYIKCQHFVIIILIFKSKYAKIDVIRNSYNKIYQERGYIMKTNIQKLENFSDYLNVFKVFESFPFFEKWTLDEIRNEFESNVREGQIYGYYIDGKCVGFISMRNVHENEHPLHYAHASKVLYLSDLAVLPKFRHKGIGTALLQHALNIAVSQGYKYAYLRMNENNSMADNIAKHLGFSREFDSYEIVSHSSSREKKRNTEEFRIFMSKKL